MSEELESLLQRVLATLSENLRRLEKAVDALAGRTKSHFTVEEVAAETSRSPFTVRRWITEGRITAKRIDGTGSRGRLLVPAEEVDKLLHWSNKNMAEGENAEKK